ncbi:MAG TPA: hypothetical protein VFL85_00560 [Candidatus Saccharimonadales bacterium]|nr:hypothetical protein [Candidatus Saccharimonadales bacterium]
MNVKTTHVEELWQSPDGQRTIWEVTLRTDDGNEYRLKTYSPKISKLGFKGEVRSYVNARGDRFVRQVLAPSKPTFQRDDNAIRAQWAIGQAINLAAVKMDKEAITLPVIEKYAKELFATVSRVKGESLTPEQQAEAESYIKGFVQSPSAI